MNTDTTMQEKNIATGHFDCFGEMIREGDTVVTANGEATVIGQEKHWKLHYRDGHLESLNFYGKSHIRRVSKDGTMTFVPSSVPQSIVPGQ